MKKVIDRKVYNTETAELIAEWCNNYTQSDFHYCSEDLYRTKRGRWFLHGEGGPLSKYNKPAFGGGTCGDETIVPLSKGEVIDWLEERDFPETLQTHFPEAIEEA